MRNPTASRVAGSALVLLLFAAMAAAQTPAKRDIDPDTKLQRRRQAFPSDVPYDIRRLEDAASGDKSSTDRRLAVSNIVDRLPAAARGDVRVEFYSNGRVRSLGNFTAGLTQPDESDAAEIALRFLRQFRDELALSDGAIDHLRQTNRVRAGNKVLVNLDQSIGGAPVLGGRVQFCLNDRGQILAVRMGTVAAATLPLDQLALDRETAVRAAFRLVGREAPAELAPMVSGGITRYADPQGARAVYTQLVWFPRSAGLAVPAYRMIIDGTPPDRWEIVLDGRDGELLFRRNLLLRAAQGRVWTLTPLTGDRELVDFPDEWFVDDQTLSSGNNVDAFWDLDGDDWPDPTPAEGLQGGRAYSPGSVFDFPAANGTLGGDPVQTPAAAVTNAFYHVNRAHDWFYGLGFTEIVGNLQQDNHGHGGVGGDPLRTHVQYLWVGDNSYTYPAPDGESPDLYLGIMSLGTYSANDDRDTAYDGQLIVHEYTHNVTARIVGGPNTISCMTGLQSRGLGEGWSDYFALSYSNDPVMGAYLSGDMEKGIRRQGYENYTFTYEDLGNDGFDAPHDEGEVWAAALWDLRKQLGAAVTDQLVMDGLQGTPCAPSMIDARDAILAIATEEQQRTLWEVFARHGMGASASGVDGWEGEGTVFNAAYDLPQEYAPGNHTPTVSSRPQMAEKLGGNYSYRIQARDMDMDPLSYQLADGPATMSVDAKTGTLNWTTSFTGVRGKVKVSDGSGGQLMHGFYIPVFSKLLLGSSVAIDGPARSMGFAWFPVFSRQEILQVSLRGSTGDPNLIVYSPYGDTFESYQFGANETLSIPAASIGVWQLMVNATAAYQETTLEIKGLKATLVEPGDVVSDLAAEETSELFYKVEVPEDTGMVRIRVQGGSGDADLYARWDEPATCQAWFTETLCDFDEFSGRKGNNEVIEIRDPKAGTLYFTLQAYTDFSGVSLDVQLYAAGEIPPTISSGGVTLATQTPTIRQISPGAVITVYGSDFAEAGTSALAPVLDGSGKVSTVLANTCLEINGERSPLFAVLPTQINAQVSDMVAPGTGNVVVVRGCGTANERRGEPVAVGIGDVSPGFFNFINKTSGINPLAALHGGGPGLVGEPGMISGAETTPAAEGEYISLFGTGFGATDPPLAAGEIPAQRYPNRYGQAGLVHPVTFSLGGVPVPSSNIYYAGSAPCCAGLQQFVIRVPEQTPSGNQGVMATVNGVSTPSGPYVEVSQE